MLKLRSLRVSPIRAFALCVSGAVMFLPLAGCDLSKNTVKMDRSSDMEVQDYRDAMAERLPESDSKKTNEAGIPDLKPYMVTPADKLKPMPLVSVSVNQSVPLKDVLYEVAEQADYDLELDPRITGSIIFSARNRPFDQVIDRISESAGLRYKFDDDSLRVELDTPYHQIYKINYLSYVRTNTSSISNDVAVVSGEGADTGSKFKAEAKSESNFWGELDTNLTQILGVNRDAGTLRTRRDPRVSAVAASPAPVEPVLLQADGEISADGSPAPQVQVAAPQATLNIQNADEEEDRNANRGGDDPFGPRFSVNKQAGIISIFATERLHKQISGYLDELRRSVTSQVLIEAKVLEVSLSDEFSAGIDWNSIDIFGNRVTFGVDTVGAALAPAFDPPSDPALGMFGAYSSGDFNAAIQAMQRFGTVRALASPRLTVLNNQSAVLNVAKNQVYFELDVTTNQNDTQTSVDIDSNIRNVPEGVLINVQPAIDLDSQTVSMAVRPTVTRITDYVNDPGVAFAVADAGLSNAIVSPVPVVNVQEFDSVIRMYNAQPIVMGGLIQDRASSVQNAVPVLGEIPIIGAAFRNHSDKIEKTELVVMMKATIIDGGTSSVHNTDKDIFRTFSQDRRPFDF